MSQLLIIVESVRLPLIIWGSCLDLTSQLITKQKYLSWLASLPSDLTIRCPQFCDSCNMFCEALSFWWLLGTAPFGIIFLQNIKCTSADPALLSLLVSQEDDSKDTDGRTNIEDSDNKNRVRSVITNSQQCVLKHSLHD